MCMYTYVYYTYVCVYKQGKKISFFTVNYLTKISLQRGKEFSFLYRCI